MSSDYSDVFYAQMKLVRKTLLLGLEREYKFHKTRKWRFDFAYPDIQLAVEIDGGQWRAGGGRHNMFLMEQLLAQFISTMVPIRV